MIAMNTFVNKVGFAVGTGRCGTQFLHRVMSLEPSIASVHERNRLNESFHQYCKWYRLPVDHEGFLQTKEIEIKHDLEAKQLSFEASGFLSNSIQELYERFAAKFIFLIRSPEKVVNSYLRKGWHTKTAVRANPMLIPSYQDCEHFHHFLGRIMPSEEKFTQWNQMSRVGKIAWYWNALNAKVLEQFENIPQSHWRIEKIEELSYNRYLDLAQFLGFQSTVSLKTYNNLVESRPNTLTDVPTIATWNASEITEFESEVAPIAERFGYEYRVSHLPIPQTVQSASKPQSKPSRFMHKLSNFLVNR